MKMEAQNDEINCHGHIGSGTLRCSCFTHIIQKEKKSLSWRNHFSFRTEVVRLFSSDLKLRFSTQSINLIYNINRKKNEEKLYDHLDRSRKGI